MPCNLRYGACKFETSLNRSICEEIIPLIFAMVARATSRKLLHIKVTPDLQLTYSKNGGKPGVGIENEKYSLYLNFIDKTYRIYLFIFV